MRRQIGVEIIDMDTQGRRTSAYVALIMAEVIVRSLRLRFGTGLPAAFALVRLGVLAAEDASGLVAEFHPGLVDVGSAHDQSPAIRTSMPR